MQKMKLHKSTSLGKIFIKALISITVSGCSLPSQPDIDFSATPEDIGTDAIKRHMNAAGQIDTTAVKDELNKYILQHTEDLFSFLKKNNFKCIEKREGTSCYHITNWKIKLNDSYAKCEHHTSVENICNASTRTSILISPQKPYSIKSINIINL